MHGFQWEGDVFPLHPLPFFYAAISGIPSIQIWRETFWFVWLYTFIVHLSPRGVCGPNYQFQIFNLIPDFLSYLRIHHTRSNTWVKLMPIYSFCPHNHWAFALSVLCSIKSVIKCDLLALFGGYFPIFNNCILFFVPLRNWMLLLLFFYEQTT